MFTTNTNQPTQPDRGGGSVSDYPNSTHHHQSFTPQNTPQKYQFNPQHQNQQQLSPLPFSTENTLTFTRFGPPTPTVEKTPHHMSVAFVLKENPWLDADKLRSTLQKHPKLTAHQAAQDQSPDPVLIDATEKRRNSMVRRSSNKPRHFISLDLVYICEEQDPSVGSRAVSTTKPKKNYREGFSLTDGRNNARHVREYDKLKYLRINNQIVADLSKTRDILDGYTCQIEYKGSFETIGWNFCPSGQLDAVRRDKNSSGEDAAIILMNRYELCMDRMRHPPIQSQPVSSLCMLTCISYCILLSLITLPLFDFFLLFMLRLLMIRWCLLQRQRQQYRICHLPLFLHKSPLCL